MVNKDALVIWEAQFGDFFNGAQIIVDQYLVAAEDKWGQTSGLVLLLPHGYEGQGPEHSSGRIERFLTLAAEDNIQVCNATTAAQFFHLLRRQMRRTVRKPLVVFTPKSLLRAKASRSPIEALVEGSFEEVLDDPRVSRSRRRQAHRPVLGQDRLRRARRPRQARRAGGHRPGGAALPVALRGGGRLVERYPNADQLFWLQEEPENMGPWNAIKGRLFEAHSDHWIHRESRSESGSPATGSHAIHLQEQEDVVSRIFANLD